MTLNFDSADQAPTKIRFPETGLGSNAQRSPVAQGSSVPPPIAVSRVEKPRLSIPVSQFGGSPVKSTTGSPKQTKLYDIGSNNFLSIEDGVPYLLKKAADGSLVKVSEVSREELVQKLNSLRVQKQTINRPVCSVAPQPKVQTGSAATSSAPPSSTVYLQSTSQNQPPVAVVVNQNPQQKSEAVIVGGVGNQLPLVLTSSAGSILQLGNTQTLVLNAPSSQSQQPQFQVIQVVPQILLSTTTGTSASGATAGLEQQRRPQ